MENLYPLLAEPLAIGSYTARNRVVVPPMANFGLAKQGGAVTPEHIAHYEAYAAGGPGWSLLRPAE